MENLQLKYSVYHQKSRNQVVLFKMNHVGQCRRCHVFCTLICDATTWPRKDRIEIQIITHTNASFGGARQLCFVRCEAESC